MHGAEHGDIVQLYFIYVGVISLSCLASAVCSVSHNKSGTTTLLGTKIVLMLNYSSLGLTIQFMLPFLSDLLKLSPAYNTILTLGEHAVFSSCLMKWSVLHCQLSPKGISYIFLVYTSVAFNAVSASLFLCKTLSYSTLQIYLAQQHKVSLFFLNVALKRAQQSCSKTQEWFYLVDFWAASYILHADQLHAEKTNTSSIHIAHIWILSQWL